MDSPDVSSLLLLWLLSLFLLREFPVVGVHFTNDLHKYYEWLS